MGAGSVSQANPICGITRSLSETVSGMEVRPRAAHHLACDAAVTLLACGHDGDRPRLGLQVPGLRPATRVDGWPPPIQLVGSAPRWDNLPAHSSQVDLWRDCDEFGPVFQAPKVSVHRQAHVAVEGHVILVAHR